MQNQDVVMLNFANSYKQAYEILIGTCNSVKSNELMLLYVPATTIAAFACELYMKVIILKERGQLEKGHYLDKLFVKLPANAQNNIKLITSQLYKSRSQEELDFDKCLADNAKLFIECRYCYESGVQANTLFVDSFLNAFSFYFQK